MAVTALLHFNIRVDAQELQALQQFYCDVVGLRVGARPALRSVGAWLYAGDTAVLHLTQRGSGETVAPQAPHSLPAPQQRCSALDHIALACTGLPDYLARLQAHGIDYARSDKPAGGTTQLFFVDPAGVGIELSFSEGQAPAAPGRPADP
jgi:catechol 2,3-dioxygenase-like lactoylglutathione lyase family enzyme